MRINRQINPVFPLELLPRRNDTDNIVEFAFSQRATETFRNIGVFKSDEIASVVFALNINERLLGNNQMNPFLSGQLGQHDTFQHGDAGSVFFGSIESCKRISHDTCEDPCDNYKSREYFREIFFHDFTSF